MRRQNALELFSSNNTEVKGKGKAVCTTCGNLLTYSLRSKSERAPSTSVFEAGCKGVFNEDET